MQSYDMYAEELWFAFNDETLQRQEISVRPNSGVFVFLKHIHPFNISVGASETSRELDIIGFTDSIDSPNCEDMCVGFALFVPEDADGDGPETDSFDYAIYTFDSEESFYTFKFTVNVEQPSE